MMNEIKICTIFTNKRCKIKFMASNYSNMDTDQFFLKLNVKNATTLFINFKVSIKMCYYCVCVCVCIDSQKNVLSHKSLIFFFL